MPVNKRDFLKLIIYLESTTTAITEKETVTSPAKSKKTARFSVKAAAETDSRKNSDFSENSSIPELPSNDQTSGYDNQKSHQYTHQNSHDGGATYNTWYGMSCEKIQNNCFQLRIVPIDFAVFPKDSNFTSKHWNFWLDRLKQTGVMIETQNSAPKVWILY